jgi:hypothetical protein
MTVRNTESTIGSATPRQGKIPLRLVWFREQCSPSICITGGGDGVPPRTEITKFFVPFQGIVFQTTWDPPPNLTPSVYAAAWSGFVTVTVTGIIDGRTFTVTVP